MTSVVDTSVKHFHSGMFAAPVLNGVAGAMLGVLNACLITGFDTKTATSLVVAGGVATLSFAGSHSAVVDSVVLVAGSSIDALNGEQKVTAIGSGVVRFATAEADATATGTITFKMAPAGWTQPFTGTNLATYKCSDPAGTGMILRVDDTGTTSCRVVGYEQMTDVNTGAGAFPTAAQITGGGYWAKSGNANATAVGWVLIADSRKVIFNVSPYFPTGLGSVTRGFGDDLALRPGGDPYACSLNYSASPTASSQSDGGLDAASVVQHAMSRSYTGLGSSVLHGVYPYTGSAGLSGVDSFFGVFPSPVDGGLRLSKRFFATAANVAPRSDLPGLFAVPMNQLYASFAPRDIVNLPGSGALAGRKLIALMPTATLAGSVSQHGISFVDITGPWR